MTNRAGDSGLFQERMTAEAGILLEPVASRDMLDAMAEEAAQVTHLLLERRGVRVRIVPFGKQQRMAALHAHVFMTAVAIGQLLVVMLAEKARQRVPHPRDRAVFCQVAGAAPAPPVSVCRRLEDLVVDVMSPHRTREFPQ
jgi:hypothetical protein